MPPVSEHAGTPDSGDRATTPPLSEHAAEEGHLAEAGAELDAVEAALVRLEDGSFESCEVCGAPIGRDRLLADPLLTRCPQHSAASSHA